MPKEELAQNLKAVLQDVGENIALLHLAIHLNSFPDWIVLRNLVEPGCDILLVPVKNIGARSSIKIEVKSRQTLVTKRKNKNCVHFDVSQAEKDSADFIICYLLDRGHLFVVPKSDLRCVNNGTKKSYKVVIYWSNKEERYNAASLSYLDAWKPILDKLR